ncbi:Uncharacterised protein [Brucella suis]|nr:Uncharacterised protein [Brucella suis]
MEQKRDIRNHTPESIEKQDEDGHEKEADDTCHQAHLDGVAAKIGADGAFFDDGERSGQGACAQKRGEDDRILNGEAAADLAGAARDRLADDRRAQHLAVENDGEGAVDVLGGDIRELACTEAVETERNDRLIGPRVEARARIGEALAGKGDLILDRIFDGGIF